MILHREKTTMDPAVKCQAYIWSWSIFSWKCDEKNDCGRTQQAKIPAWPYLSINNGKTQRKNALVGFACQNWHNDRIFDHHLTAGYTVFFFFFFVFFSWENQPYSIFERPFYVPLYLSFSMECHHRSRKTTMYQCMDPTTNSGMAVFLDREERDTNMKHFSHLKMHEDDHRHSVNWISITVSGVGSLHPSEDVGKESPACFSLLHWWKRQQRDAEDTSTNFGRGQHFGSPFFVDCTYKREQSVNRLPLSFSCI